jgi:ABC-type nitrate/sulfonate/bicarbonate transport system ATPase subunit
MSGGPVTGDDRKGSINLEKVTQRFALPREGREFTAVQDVSFEVGGGEFVSIVGPSGCGKSTLLSLMPGSFPSPRGDRPGRAAGRWRESAARLRLSA